MKISVIGAGTIGTAIVQELCERTDAVSKVQVCDTRSRSLQALHDRVDSSLLRSFQIDARDHSVLGPIIQGSDCVVSCVPPELNPELAALCLDRGIHFCDLGGNDSIVQQELNLDAQAREKSVWIVPNCGLAPGLVNILCLYGVDQFDTVDAARLRVGDVPLHPEPPFNFRISWSAERIIDDYTNPALLIEDGAVKEVDALSHDETITFGEPFGAMEAFCTQGGLSTLTDALSGRVQMLDHKTIRWPGHAHQMRFIMGLGFGRSQKIDVRTHLTYRDVLVRRLRNRLGGPHADAVLMRVLIRGQKDGADKTLVFEMVEQYDKESDFTAMMRCTSIPTVATVCLIGQHQIPGGGASVPENVVPREDYYAELADRGLNISMQWYDGHVEVTDLESLQASKAASG
jgi:saccharopine dehydrogenase-like NADP-dependent oxidoreductase